MEPYPHHYPVKASAHAEGNVVVAAAGLPALQTAAPAQYDGPGDRWSPETLLVAAAADCFILTFRAVARASKLAWVGLHCDADGLLDRADGTTRFTGMTVHATLTVPTGSDADKARRLLEKAERGCLITNSLVLQPTFSCDIEFAPAASEPAAAAG